MQNMTLLCPGNAITLVQHTCALNPPEQFRFLIIKMLPFSFSRLNVEVAEGHTHTTLALLSPHSWLEGSNPLCQLAPAHMKHETPLSVFIMVHHVLGLFEHEKNHTEKKDTLL
jgi:hypothetical protein